MEWRHRNQVARGYGSSASTPLGAACILMADWPLPMGSCPEILSPPKRVHACPDEYQTPSEAIPPYFAITKLLNILS